MSFASDKSWKIDRIKRFVNNELTEDYFHIQQFSANGNVEISNLLVNPAELKMLKELIKDL